MKFFLILVLLPISFSFTQQYEHFFVVHKNGLRVEGNDGKMSNHLFEGYDISGKKFSSPLKDIERFYNAEGTKSMMMGGIGFLIGSIIGLSIGLADNSLNGDEFIVIAPALGGTLIGILVGSSQYSWELVPLPQSAGIHINFNYRRAL